MRVIRADELIEQIDKMPTNAVVAFEIPHNWKPGTVILVECMELRPPQGKADACVVVLRGKHQALK